MPKKGILKPSKFTTQVKEPSLTNSDQIKYPDLDDLDYSLNQPQGNTSVEQKKSLISFDDEINKETFIQDVKDIMMKVFSTNVVFELEDLKIIGIIETDYLKLGDYGIVLASGRNSKNSREFLTVFPLKNTIN